MARVKNLTIKQVLIIVVQVILYNIIERPPSLYCVKSMIWITPEEGPDFER